MHEICVMLKNCCLHIFLITFRKSLKVFQHVCQNQQCNLIDCSSKFYSKKPTNQQLVTAILV